MAAIGTCGHELPDDVGKTVYTIEYLRSVDEQGCQELGICIGYVCPECATKKWYIKRYSTALRKLQENSTTKEGS